MPRAAEKFFSMECIGIRIIQVNYLPGMHVLKGRLHVYTFVMYMFDMFKICQSLYMHSQSGLL